LRATGLEFDIRPAQVDEGATRRAARAEAKSPEATALLLAELKARHISHEQPDALVIGADQILVCDGDWFEKPSSVAAARKQLLTLRGRAHVLATAMVCGRGAECLWQHVERPRLTMRQFSDAFLDAYLAAEGERVISTVGAYRLEGPGIHLFGRVDGEHSAILGLPLLPLLDFLRRHDVLAV
jgi:septum formation protein